MNYLAHLYLSGNDPELRLGNFIADHLKGVSPQQYSAGVQRGIRLHHTIDRFTDTHAVVGESKRRLQPLFRKYAPVIVDIFYDHYLAQRWAQYHPEPLAQYAAGIYREMQAQEELLPERARVMLPFMVRHDWLTNYAKLEGIQRVMNGMSRRSRFDSGMERAPSLLAEHHHAFGEEFDRFFPELQAEVKHFIQHHP